jgi:hypothetical protein
LNTNQIIRIPKKVKRWNTEKSRRLPLELALWAELIEFYREDIAQLSRLIGRDLGPWLDGRPLAPASAPSPAGSLAAVVRR